MYCLKPFLINNDLLFSFVLNKNGVAESCSFDIILQLRKRVFKSFVFCLAKVLGSK